MGNFCRPATRAAAALLLALAGCTSVHTERREVITGQAFSADERAWRSTHDTRRMAYRPAPRPDRVKKLDPKSPPPRPVVQREDFTPARLEPFRGNPRPNR